MTRLLACLVALLLSGMALGSAQTPGAIIASRFRELTPASTWTLVETVALDFDAFHPQGMVRVGTDFVVSAVEIRRPTSRYPVPVNGFDRDTGDGVGHLFRISGRGRVLRDVVTGEGTMYHPSGLDYDGQFIWMAAAEYRPHSRSIVYRVNADTLKAEELFRVPEHVGAMAYDAGRRVLHGMTWGSREFLSWADPAQQRPPVPSAPRRNPSFHLDYQDCKSLGEGQALCGGLRTLRLGTGDAISVGGLDLVSLDDGRPLHQVPVDRRSPSGRVLTQNPFWIEPHGLGLRAWFLPDDGRGAILVYDLQP